MHKQIKVKPNSKQQIIEEALDGSLTIHLKSQPVDGKANKELIEILAKKFDVSKFQIRIKSGLSSRNKLVEINTDFYKIMFITYKKRCRLCSRITTSI